MPTKITAIDGAAAFTPTSDQRRLLNAIHECPSIRTIREICEFSDIGRRTYYNWCKNPGFRLWFATTWSSRMLVEGITLLNQARAKASYKFPYWKALFDLTFDPRGLAQLQKWQQAMSSLDGSAFDCGPEAAYDYDYHLDPTSECNDVETPKTPGAGVQRSAAAPLANPAENGTFSANLPSPAAITADDCPSPVAVARVFRHALTEAGRASCIAHRQNGRARAAATRLILRNSEPQKHNPEHDLGCLTETIWSEPLFGARIMWDTESGSGLK